MPLFWEAPWMKRALSFSISSFFFLPMALRSESACPMVKPDRSTAMRITCSW